MHSNDYGFGLYTGAHFGGTSVSGGAGYQRHDTTTTRGLAFGGFSDSLKGSYSANTGQLFGELSQDFTFGSVIVQPYAQAVYVANGNDSFTESGGAAALAVGDSRTNALFATLGTRVTNSFALSEGIRVKAQVGAGWQHAFANNPTIGNAYASGGQKFTVLGTQAAEDALALEAALGLSINANASIGLNYSGMLSADAQNHDATAKVEVKF